MHLNHPQTTPSPSYTLICGKLSSMKLVSGAKKVVTNVLADMVSGEAFFL